MDDPLAGLLTTNQTAERLGTTPALLATWRYRRTGPAWIKFGGGVFYRATEVDAYLAARDQEASA